MISKGFKIKNPSGIHAIYAAELCQLTQKYNSDLFIKKEKRVANCKSVISILGLSVHEGETVTIMADGIDEKDALQGILDFLRGLAG
ncbi:MAG: HPr family phosphocarrier protein [Eubacteriaceae bacterium]|jgi:phosphotransferase system HPr (HPr) family protein|nr:HPr family phosphocarrier protein [Eubacteriaceae bacterium]MDD4507870.1 HPr family phosphocarrier protein [Eubacteriaceae bacterium]